MAAHRHAHLLFTGRAAQRTLHVFGLRHGFAADASDHVAGLQLRKLFVAAGQHQHTLVGAEVASKIGVQWRQVQAPPRGREKDPLPGVFTRLDGGLSWRGPEIAFHDVRASDFWPSYGSPAFWAEIRTRYRSHEYVAQTRRGAGMGIGVLRLS